MSLLVKGHREELRKKKQKKKGNVCEATYRKGPV